MVHALGQYIHEDALAASPEVSPDSVGKGQRHSRQIDCRHRISIFASRHALPMAYAYRGNRERFCLSLDFFTPVIVGGIRHTLATEKLLEGCANVPKTMLLMFVNHCLRE